MGTNLTKFKYDLSQNNWLVCYLFVLHPEIYNFHVAVLFCHAVRGEETIRFLVFKLVFTSAFRSYFPMFSPMLFLLVKKKNGNSVLFGFVLSSEQFEVNN